MASFKIAWLPGVTMNRVPGATCLPLTISAATAKSLNRPLAHEPMNAWSTFCPATSRAGLHVVGDLVRQDDLRLERREVDRDDLVVLGVIVGKDRLERPLGPAFEILLEDVVVREEGELGRELGRDRRHGQTTVHVDPRQPVAVPLEIAPGEVAVLPRDVMDDVALRTPARGASPSIIDFGRRPDQKPRLALTDDVQHLRRPHAPGEAI